MNTKKRLLCIFLIICIAVSLLPASALAADNDTYTSLSTVSSAVRKAMIQRKAECTVTCNFSGYSSYDSLCHAIIDSAMAYTGRPDGGDYILYNLENWSYTYYGSTYSIPARLKFNFKYYTTDAQERDVTSRVNSVISSFGFTKDTSDYAKVSTIYNYITSHVTYDQANYGSNGYDLKYTAYAALLNGTAVCQGYSLLLYRMLLECGVPCRIISDCSNNDSHSWNIIKLGDVWYNADATWDTGRNPYIYFLRGDTVACFPNHVRDSKFVTSGFYREYPMSYVSYRSSDDAGLNLNVACPDFSMPSIDGGTVSKSSVAGKPSIIVFYGDKCAVSRDVISNLSKASWAKTDKINIIAASFSDVSGVTSYRSTYASDNSYIRFCCGQEASSSLFTLLNACGYTDSTVSTPVCYVLDKYGNIKFQSIGDVDIRAFKLYLNGMESSDAGIPKFAFTGYMNTSGNPYFNLCAASSSVSCKICHSGSKIGTTTATSFIDKAADIGYAYYYKIKEITNVSSAGNYYYNDPIAARCHCAKPTVSLTLSGGHPYLSWSAVAGASKYDIYRSTDGKSFVKFTSCTDTSWLNSSASSGTTYYYKIIAVSRVSSSANSVYSNTVYIRAK